MGVHYSGKYGNTIVIYPKIVQNLKLLAYRISEMKLQQGWTDR